MTDDQPDTAGTCDGYEWRGEIPWKCQLPPGHKAPDGTFLGAQCRGNSPPATLTTAELDRLRRVERHAREVMDCLDEYGPSIVPHLLDDDDNSGEFLRRALSDVAPPCCTEAGGLI